MLRLHIEHEMIRHCTAASTVDRLILLCTVRSTPLTALVSASAPVSPLKLGDRGDGTPNEKDVVRSGATRAACTCHINATLSLTWCLMPSSIMVRFTTPPPTAFKSCVSCARERSRPRHVEAAYITPLSSSQRLGRTAACCVLAAGQCTKPHPRARSSSKAHESANSTLRHPHVDPVLSSQDSSLTRRT